MEDCRTSAWLDTCVLCWSKTCSISIVKTLAVQPNFLYILFRSLIMRTTLAINLIHHCYEGKSVTDFSIFLTPSHPNVSEFHIYKVLQSNLLLCPYGYYRLCYVIKKGFNFSLLLGVKLQSFIITSE